MANTTIGNNFTIEGEITSEDNIVVQGTVKGRLKRRNLSSSKIQRQLKPT